MMVPQFWEFSLVLLLLTFFFTLQPTCRKQLAATLLFAVLCSFVYLRGFQWKDWSVIVLLLGFFMIFEAVMGAQYKCNKEGLIKTIANA